MEAGGCCVSKLHERPKPRITAFKLSRVFHDGVTKCQPPSSYLSVPEFTGLDSVLGKIESSVYLNACRREDEGSAHKRADKQLINRR